MTRYPPVDIDRREALRRAALVLGGILSAPTIAGVLAGCESRHADATTYRARALTDEQLELVATMAEHILPETDTPGARAAGVPRFIDTMLAEYYPATDRESFVKGLQEVDARASTLAGKSFLRASSAQQRGLLEAMDRETFASPAGPSAPFFRRLKELTIVGYYTSQVGATRELAYSRVPGRFSGCVPLTSVGRTWST